MESLWIWILIGFIGAAVSIFATAKISQIISDNSTVDLKRNFNEQSEIYQTQNSELNKINEELNNQNLVLSKSIENLTQQNIRKTEKNLEKTITILNDTKDNMVSLRRMQHELEEVVYIDMEYKVKLNDADIKQIESFLENTLGKINYTSNDTTILPLAFFVQGTGINNTDEALKNMTIYTDDGPTRFWAHNFVQPLAINFDWSGDGCVKGLLNNPKNAIKIFYGHNPEDTKRNPYYSRIDYYPANKNVIIYINDFPLYLESSANFNSKLDFEKCNKFRMSISHDVESIHYFWISDSKSRFLYAKDFEIIDGVVYGNVSLRNTN